MAHVNKEIVGEALSLSIEEKVELVEILLSSLDEPDKKVDELWAEEAESRIKAYESGQLKAISLDKVLSKYK